MRETMIVLALAATLKACVPVCTSMQTRCNGPYVEICDSGGQWQRVMTCDDVSGGDEPWVCCATEIDGGMEHTCLPESECGGDEQ